MLDYGRQGKDAEMSAMESEVQALQQALKAAESRFRSVVDGTIHGIIIQQDDRIGFANPAMARMFGYPEPSDMIGLSPFDDLIAEDDLSLFRVRTEAVYAGARVVPHPGWRARTRDGRELWCSSTAHTSEWLGRPAVTSFYFDISERRRGETALRESEARYRTALVAGRMGAWETDLVAGTRTWTEEGMQLFGLSLPDGRGHVGGELDEYVAAIHPEDRHLVQKFYAEADRADNYLADYRIMRPDGSIAWLSGRGQVTSRRPDGRAHRLVSIMADVTDRKASELQLQLLMREVAHRSKNLLAVVQSVARQTALSSVTIDDFSERFSTRLEGLARTYDVLVQKEWQGAPLHDLVARQFVPFLDARSERLSISGPDIVVTAEAAQAIGLALNELATNATKYGALSRPSGRVSVTWSVDEGAGQRRVRLAWLERGGPEVSAPSRTGFGSLVLRELVAYALKGEVTLDYDPAGVSWAVTFPTSKMAP
jgi:PAS domain S-box-containing protein